MNKKILLTILLSTIIGTINLLYAQNNVGIGTNAPNASSILELLATDKGLLVPRVALAAINNNAPIGAGIANSLLVYNTATAGIAPNNVTPGYYFWNGANWVRFMTGNGDAWLTLGNNGTNPTNNFLGTIDNQSLVFRTNNLERIRIRENGFIGIGVNNPTVHINYNKNQAVNDWQTKWDNDLATDAIARFQNTNATNGNRVVMGTTNYNASAFAAAAIIGIHLNAAGNGGIGVEGFSNSTAATGVLAGFTGGTNILALGWALFSNGWAGGTTAWQNVSDSRIKQDVKTIDNAISKVKSLNGVEYRFKNSIINLDLDETSLQYGFIAQDVEKVFPSMVKNSLIPGNTKIKDLNHFDKAESPQIKTMSYTSIIPILVEAIKEQQQVIEKLEIRLNQLEKK